MIKLIDDKSQWGTMHGLFKWLNNKQLEPTNTIVDIGAANGVLNSNSWELIVHNNWNALLVEPNPDPFYYMMNMHDDIGVNGHVFFENAAVAEKTGTTDLHLPENKDDDQLASLSVKHPKVIKVNTISPSDLLEKYKTFIKNIGILSIDTEGYDYNVLKEWMKTENRPQIIITESWPHLAYANLEKTSLLKTQGYNKVLHFGENEIFVQKEFYDPEYP